MKKDNATAAKQPRQAFAKKKSLKNNLKNNSLVRRFISFKPLDITSADSWAWEYFPPMSPPLPLIHPPHSCGTASDAKMYNTFNLFQRPRTFRVGM